MGWLNDWLTDLGATAPALPAAPVAKPAPLQSKPEIKSFWFQTRLPRGDMGAVEAAHYWVADGVVTICDESGKPTGNTQRLGPNDDARKIAARLAREAWVKAMPTTDFNRPLGYARSGYA